MFKKFIALASLTALCGAAAAVPVAGCSSTTETTVVSDAAADARKIITSDGSDETGDSSVVDCPATDTFDNATVEGALGASFKGPTQSAAARCSDADFTKFNSNFNDSSLTSFDDLKTGLSATCVSCLFSTTDSPNWGVIVTLGDDPTHGFANYGACPAYVEGDACGKAYEYNQLCANAACSGCSQKPDQTCINKVFTAGGACKGLTDAIASSCPALTTTTKKCGNSPLTNAKVVCGGVVSDAATDG